MKTSTTGIKLFEGRQKNAEQNAKDNFGPNGDEMIPSLRFLERLENVVRDRIDRYVDPSTRASTFIEILEGILLSPFPYPYGYTVVQTKDMVRFRVSLDPSNENQTIQPSVDDVDHNEVDCCLVYPGMSFTVIASGHMPTSIRRQAKLPFAQLLIWHSIKFIAPLQVGLEESGENEQTMLTPSVQLKGEAKNEGIPPVEINLTSCSDFTVPVEIREIDAEGLYRVSFLLGCRDVRCGEWELPMSNEHSSLLVKVTRSIAS